MYELALSGLKACIVSEESISHLKRTIVAGLSRTLLRMGDISKGMRLIANVTDPNFLQECATILEGLKQYSEAASLLEKIGKWNNAAQVWVKGNC
jgi:WD repeat-containing protein 19